jgi:hypothetical protein
MNERIETLSKKGDTDVRKIPTGMNMTGMKIKEIQIYQQEALWLKTGIEYPKILEVVCPRACCHSEDINQTDRLRINDSSGYIDQLARFVRTSNLANEVNCTFAVTSGSRIMDMNRADSAKA